MTFNQRDPIRKKQSQQQNVFGSNLVKNKPLGKVGGHPKLIEFELVDLHQVWTMGPSTHFVVRGRFEFAQEPKDGKMPLWLACTEEELDKMVVQPNWFESLFNEMSCYHEFSKLPILQKFLLGNTITWTRFRRKNFVPIMFHLDLEFIAKWVAGTWTNQPLNGE